MARLRDEFEESKSASTVQKVKNHVAVPQFSKDDVLLEVSKSL